MTSTKEYASSPCMLHELDELTHGMRPPAQRGPLDIVEWRRSERKRQIDARRAISTAERRDISTRITARLKGCLGAVAGRCVSLYWPIQGEPDLRPLIPTVIESGGTCALPVVIAQGKPLLFRSWQPGEPLQRGFWNIPVPASGREIEPDIIVAPVVAYDEAGFRLGYGGGYFDRTLASVSNRPLVFGIGFSFATIATIYPQPHDIAMDVIITEDGRFER